MRPGTLRHVGLQVAVFVVLQGVCWKPSLSQHAATGALNVELAKQEKIYRDQKRRGSYKVDRSLEDYAQVLSPQFDRSLSRLGPADRWLDVGAGEGQAILDYYAPEYDRRPGEARKRRKRGEAVAISIEDRRASNWRESAARLERDQIQYFSGKRLREYSPVELGRFRLISDVMGGFTYAYDLSLFVEKVLSLLELNGDFYTVLQDIRSETAANPPHRDGLPYLTEIVDAEGAEVRVCSWLKSIPCVNVTCEFRDDWVPPTETFHVHKVCNETAVPALVPLHYEAGTPPERRFRLSAAR